MAEVAIPPLTDPRWRMLVVEGTDRPIQLLAVKLMLTRMNREAKDSPAGIPARVRELHAFFEKNLRIASSDVKTLFGN